MTSAEFMNKENKHGVSRCCLHGFGMFFGDLHPPTTNHPLIYIMILYLDKLGGGIFGPMLAMITLLITFQRPRVQTTPGRDLEAARPAEWDF